MLVDLTNKTNWQQTSREHRYKYPGDNGEDGRQLEEGGVKHKDRCNRSGRPYWAHTWLSGLPALEFRDEVWVQDVPNGDPAPLLQVITPSVGTSRPVN
jgi:hypothetical protein